MKTPDSTKQQSEAEIAFLQKAAKRGAAIEFQTKDGQWHQDDVLTWWRGYNYRLKNTTGAQDANVESVRAKLAERAAVGLKKYGVTTERGDLSRLDWLRHAQEEAMDLAVYLERLIRDEERAK